MSYMDFDSPWKIAALIALLVILRLGWGLWQQAPSRRFMIELLDSGLIAVILVFALIRPFVVQAFFIPSGSMLPTLRPSDRILVNRFIYRINPPERGDVIVFDAPPQALYGGSGKDFVKRLVGLPGDRVRVERDVGVFVNGEQLQDAPGVPKPDYDWPAGRPGESYQVPTARYLVFGDNRIDSYDSHAWTDPETGFGKPDLEQRRVLGKAMVIFWPPGRIGLVSDSGQVHLPSAPPHEGATAAAAR
jgi:signal peptidase I